MGESIIDWGEFESGDMDEERYQLWVEELDEALYDRGFITRDDFPEFDFRAEFDDDQSVKSTMRKLEEEYGL